MKALVVAPQPFFTPRGTPFSVYYRTLVASELGLKIDLLTYGEGMDVDIPGVRIIRIPHPKILRNVKVGPSYAKLLLDILLFFRAVVLMASEKYDIVHAHEEAVFFCEFLKPFFGYKLIYDMHSSLSQQLTNFQFTTSQVLIGLFSLLEKRALRHADAVITICPDLASQACSLVRDGGKHFLIENSIFEPVRLSSASSQNGKFEEDQAPDPESLPADRTLLVYAGTLEPYQGLDILIPAFRIVQAEEPLALLLIVGGTPQQVACYRSLAERCGISAHVLFTGRVSPELAKRYCAKATLLLSPRSGGSNTPLKIYEQLASGIPLVATRIHSHTQVLTDEVAFLVDPDPEDMAQGILAALRSHDARKRIAEKAQYLYQMKYSRPVYVDKMKRLLESVR